MKKEILKKGFLQLLPATVLFGLMPLLIELLSPHLSWPLIVLSRYGISALALLAYVLFSLVQQRTKKDLIKIRSRKDACLSILAGVFLCVYAFVYISAQNEYGVAITLIYTYTFLILTVTIWDGLKWWVANRSISWESVIGSIVSFIILFLALVLSRMNDISTITEVLQSDKLPWLAIASGILFGCRIICAGEVLSQKDCDSSSRTLYEGKESIVLVYEQVTAAVLTLVSASLLMLIPQEILPQFLRFSNDTQGAIALDMRLLLLLGVVILGVMSTALANICLYKGMRILKESKSVVKTITSIEIVFGMVFITIASWVLSQFSSTENLLTAQGISSLQILGAVFIAVAITVKAIFSTGFTKRILRLKKRSAESAMLVPSNKAIVAEHDGALHVHMLSEYGTFIIIIPIDILAGDEKGEIMLSFQPVRSSDGT